VQENAGQDAQFWRLHKRNSNRRSDITLGRPALLATARRDENKKQILRSPPAASSLKMTTHKMRCHFAATIEVTLIMLPLSVPVTLTFSPAKARGLVWSLSL